MVVTYIYIYFLNSKKYDVVGKNIDGLWPV